MHAIPPTVAAQRVRRISIALRKYLTGEIVHSSAMMMAVGGGGDHMLGRTHKHIYIYRSKPQLESYSHVWPTRAQHTHIRHLYRSANLKLTCTMYMGGLKFGIGNEQYNS